ncbi:MAG: Hsp20/alpha crystallin family protein [Saprospiraceae bacterium]|nr:Hsp20/alpha crystallin family protein [Bacteroidia bacterium]NNE16557.1 Hsp20/alpha crystallin family protein [Saprospiraceae bacterium]NNL93770.1 Hsp20/alpha crystallin family protein [Saprospiraceae bacterium]
MLPVKTSLLPKVSRFFDDDWNNLFDWTNGNFSSNQSTLPSVNILENADNFIVEVAAPGMKKEDFHVELHNNVLTIKSEMKDEKKVDDKSYARREFNYQFFQRSFNINDNVVDDSKIEAKYQDGILRLTIAKKEEAKEKPARQIKIL